MKLLIVGKPYRSREGLRMYDSRMPCNAIMCNMNSPEAATSDELYLPIEPTILISLAMAVSRVAEGVAMR